MNVQPGDLAYIVNAEVPEAIGRVCKVIKPLGVIHYMRLGYAFAWHVQVSDPCRSVNGILATELEVPDITLRRIAGPSGSVDTDEQVVDQSPVEQLEPAEIA